MGRGFLTCFLSMLLLLTFAGGVVLAQETVVTVGDDKVSSDEILYLLGLEVGGDDAIAALVARQMSPAERETFVDRVVSALLFARGAILKGLHLDPRIAAQLRWNQINLLAGAYIGTLSPRLVFEEKELKAFYEKNKERYYQKEEARIRHIFTADERKARSALIHLLAGEDFASVAKSFSADFTTAKTGGELGWIRKGVLPKELDDLVFAAPLRTVRGPVETEYGFHVLEVLERREYRPLTFAEACEMVRADLKRHVLLSEVSSLQKRFQVTINPGALGRLEIH